jgi:hypothetical protein
MPVNFSVKNVPDDTAEALRLRARRNHRSLQGELLAILEAAAASGPAPPGEVREAAPAWPAPAQAMATGVVPLEPVTGAVPLEIDEARLAEVCRRHHIRRLSVFGSALRDDFRPGSDVDFLVEFDRRVPVGLRIFDVEADLAPLIGGRKPDLVNPKFLNPRLKSKILASARVLYEEG